MLRTIFATTFISMILPITAQAHSNEACVAELTIAPNQKFKPTAISQTRMPEKNGWEIQWHRNAKGEFELLALQRANLIVRRIQPTSGKILSETKFLGGARQSGPSIIHSAANGELIVARAQENTLEVFAETGGQPTSAAFNEPIKYLQIISLKNGEVFAVAGGVTSVQIFKRTDSRLESVASIRSDAAVRQMFAFAGKGNEIELALFGLDHKVHSFNYDAEMEVLEKGKTAVQLGGKLEAMAVENRMLFLAAENSREGSKIRLFSVGEPSASKSIEMQPLAGAVLWGDRAASVVVPLQTQNNLVLRRLETASGRPIGEDLPIGDGRVVHDLSQFRIGQKTYYVFSKDSSLAFIQNENEVSVIAAPERTAIRQITPAVMLENGTPVLGVLGYGPNGSTVNVISLTGTPKSTKLAPTATAE